MSDEDSFLSEESYEFEFEEDDDEDSQDQPIEEYSLENQYYQAKNLKEDSLSEAAECFSQLIKSANPKTDLEWIFKAYKQLAKIHHQQQNYTLVLQCVARLMELLPGLNGNYAEESISKIISRYAAFPDHVFTKDLYDVIVSHLQDFIQSGSSGHRLWLKININRLNSLLEMDELMACEKLIDLINHRLESVSELTRNSYALEIIAAEIAYTMKTTRDISRLSELHRRSIHVSPAITHPQVMGSIRECCAFVQFFKGNYDKARLEFYEGFKNYDEAGSSMKYKVLKYLTICCLLVESEVNPFESQETQSYAHLAEYENLMKLVEFYENLELLGYLEIVEKMKKDNDPLAIDVLFIKAQEVLIVNLKKKMLLNFAKSYEVVRFDFLFKKLYLKDENHLETMLLEMANDGSLSDVSINFLGKFIFFHSSKKARLFPTTLDESSVKTNVSSLYALSYRGPWNLPSNQYSDFESSESYLNATQLYSFLAEEETPRSRANSSGITEMFFNTSALSLDMSLEQEEWLKYMLSSFPKKRIEVFSQKDKVMSEQRKESQKPPEESRENEEAAANTKKGILETQFAAEPENRDLTELNTPKEKLDLLQEWAHQLALNARSI